MKRIFSFLIAFICCISLICTLASAENIPAQEEQMLIQEIAFWYGETPDSLRVAMSKADDIDIYNVYVYDANKPSYIGFLSHDNRTVEIVPLVDPLQSLPELSLAELKEKADAALLPFWEEKISLSEEFPQFRHQGPVMWEGKVTAYTYIFLLASPIETALYSLPAGSLITLEYDAAFECIHSITVYRP